MLQKINQKFLNIIKQAYYSLVDSDISAYPVGQAVTSQKPMKFTRLSVYGVCSNPPKDSHIVMFNSQGQESVKFGILNDFLNRKKGLKEGEVAIINTKTQTTFFLNENGEIDIVNAAKVNVIEGEVNVINGDTNITNGNINVINGDVIADGISLKNHKHLGNLGYDTSIPVLTPTPIPGTPPSSNSSGDIIDGSGTNLSSHFHIQGNDSNGDIEAPIGGPQ
jgi:hypothetical protein